MKSKTERLNDMRNDQVDAVSFSFSELVQMKKDKLKKLERHIRKLYRYKKISAIMIGAIYGMAVADVSSFWTILLGAILAVSAVGFVWGFIDGMAYG